MPYYYTTNAYTTGTTSWSTTSTTSYTFNYSNEQLQSWIDSLSKKSENRIEKEISDEDIMKLLEDDT